MLGKAKCPECDDGHLTITDCPQAPAHISQEMHRTASLADLYAKGLPPVAGGALEQSAWFVEAARWLWREQERHKWPED